MPRFSFLVLLFGFYTGVNAHDGPDPLFHWSFKGKFIKEQTLEAQRGPAVSLASTKYKSSNRGIELSGEGGTPHCVVEAETLPIDGFTITSWCSVHRSRQYGGIIGVQEDNGGFEKGWVLGYDKERFVVTISTQETDDGDGKLVSLESKTKYIKGKFYHVATTYDGKQLRLYLNGKLEATSDEPGGNIIYPKETVLGLGGYYDSNEDFPHAGEIISVQVYRDVAKPAWLAAEFNHNAELVSAPIPEGLIEPFKLVVDPYLQYGTTDGMTVMWETNLPSEGVVNYGETAECKQTQVGGNSESGINEIRLKGLKPGTQYFYRTTSQIGNNQSLASEVKTFQTDGGPGTPFAFAIISDTQGNPTVSGELAKHAWEQRPNFLLHPGDLVSTGKNKTQWVEQFFSSMDPLVSRVPFFPVLGNHEQNADNYYAYMSLPDPEYYYTFTYGDAQFFMLDTNKKCDSNSEQYRWLEQELSKSKAVWKFVCHHHPAYSSDENDYGNLWKQNKGSRGDANARKLTPLFDKYGVDIIWNGHIHSYERTWPIKAGKPAEEGSPVYMITGGGGGHLETPGPFRNPFELLVRKGHTTQWYGSMAGNSNLKPTI